MDFFEDAKPNLIEPGVKYFLHNTLKNCHVIREQFYNHLFNLGLLFLFLFILGGILIYKYKGRQSPQEVAIQNKKKHQYILEKIKQFQISKQQAQQQLITGLPHWENEYVASLLNPTTTFFAEKLVH
jgi:hypothetical protein